MAMGAKYQNRIRITMGGKFSHMQIIIAGKYANEVGKRLKWAGVKLKIAHTKVFC